MSRTATRTRETKETTVSVSIDLDGTSTTTVSTGLPFFDHMLDQLGRHGGFDLTVEAKGDLHVDGHHTIEDVGIVVGETFAEALGDKAGIRRFASGLYPLDEALVEVALDLSGRAHAAIDLPFGEVLPLGDPPFNPEMAQHFLEKYELMCLKITSKFELRRICGATGATACVRLGAPTAEEMGSISLATTKELGGRTVTVLEQSDAASSKIATVVLRASTASLALKGRTLQLTTSGRTHRRRECSRPHKWPPARASPRRSSRHNRASARSRSRRTRTINTARAPAHLWCE